MDVPFSSSSPRMTLRDLARRLGLSHATVSMALRDHPNIAEGTRKRVKEEAARCGYRPEPMLSALASYRQGKRPSTYHGTLAWLMNDETREEHFSTPLFKQYFEGACRRAGNLGFRVEEFTVREPGMPPGRMSDILLARGVQGILVAPQPRPNCRLDIRWEWFSAATFGFSLVHPRLHLVTSTQYRNGMAATRKMQDLGYERIGLFGSEVHDERTDRNFSAGFHIASLRQPQSRRVPPLLIPSGLPGKQTREKIRNWVARWRVDAVVCVGGMQELFLEAGYKIPGDLAVALLTIQDQYPGFAGMDEQGARCGAAAVDLVVGMIHRGERGVPEVPYRVLIEGEWRDAPSAPPAARRQPLRSRGRRTPASV
jgi:DNA-binding LacI/PurR family transcriptional regulator